MTERTRFDSPAFDAVARGVVALSQLIADGLGDGPDADAVRDALDAPLSTLTPDENVRARWLAEDLYTLGELASDRPLEPMTPQARTTLAQADLARRCGQLDEALTLIRHLQAHLPLATLCELRGALWQDAGQHEAAAAFLGRAAEIELTRGLTESAGSRSL